MTIKSPRVLFLVCINMDGQEGTALFARVGNTLHSTFAVTRRLLVVYHLPACFAYMPKAKCSSILLYCVIQPPASRTMERRRLIDSRRTAGRVADRCPN